LVQWIPLVVSIIVALAAVPAALRELERRGLVRENYRGASVAFPAGLAAVAASLIALGPAAIADHASDGDVWPSIGAPIGIVGMVLYVVGVAVLGLIDDLIGAGDERGWRGHARATAGGSFSPGLLKAAGAVGLALFVLAGSALDTGDYLLAAAVLVLATNFFNLLDLRPGRSLKTLALVGAALTIGSMDLDPLWALGLFVGPLLVLLPFDLREQGMLGDTGSNMAGAVAGLWLILTLDTTGQLIALALIGTATIYGEFRSISRLIDRTPGLRHLDSLGRSHA
jgi:UDP-N-acetylmuramyl pentapeptide phosphotransferase/UDP-N-acetylglucosamine-1-phosphate transferase